MTNQWKLFVMPDATLGDEKLTGTEATLADVKATISRVADGAVERLLANGARDLLVSTVLEEADCYAVAFEWACKGHTHESMISGRLVQS